MIEAASEEAVEGARWRGDRVLPLCGSYCFDTVPDRIEALCRAHERVIVVLADALGWHRLCAFADEPFAARLLRDGLVTRLTTQFPSTTVAHVTTLCTGLPVGRTGFYEWFQYHEAANGLVAPLLFARPGAVPGSLGVDAAAFYAFEDTLVARLGRQDIPVTTFQNASHSASPFSRIALAGSTARPFADPADALSGAAAVVRGMTFLYLDAVDSACHAYGPASAEATAATREVLGALEQLAGMLTPGTALAVTADHGQVAAAPERCLYLNRIWPELGDLLALPGVAGSPRDVFLHVRDGHVDEVVGGLRERLGETATVDPIETLIADGIFGDVTDVLRRRLGDVVVLPADGHEAYWYAPPAFEQKLHGHHGGLSPEEAHTWFGVLEA